MAQEKEQNEESINDESTSADVKSDDAESAALAVCPEEKLLPAEILAQLLRIQASKRSLRMGKRYNGTNYVSIAFLQSTEQA